MSARQTSAPTRGRNPRRAGTFSAWVRDLHLHAGLFASPYVLLFAVSVFYLVHRALPAARTVTAGARSAVDLPLPTNLDQLSGRERIDALRPALDRAGVRGEVGWVQHQARENRLVVPVSAPGRVTTVTIDLARRDAQIVEQTTGLAAAWVELHKAPGPHLVDIRRNWFPMRLWSWLADATVYLVLFLTLSGVYLWLGLRSERRIGLGLLFAGAASFLILVYAVVH
jgi:hypothetical protein